MRWRMPNDHRRPPPSAHPRKPTDAMGPNYAGRFRTPRRPRGRARRAAREGALVPERRAEPVQYTSGCLERGWAPGAGVEMPLHLDAGGLLERALEQVVRVRACGAAGERGRRERQWRAIGEGRDQPRPRRSGGVRARSAGQAAELRRVRPGPRPAQTRCCGYGEWSSPGPGVSRGYCVGPSCRRASSSSSCLRTPPQTCSQSSNTPSSAIE
jgi:hypothetical protein